MKDKKTIFHSSLEKVSTISLKERLNACLDPKRGFKAITLLHLPSLTLASQGAKKESLLLQKPKPMQKIAVKALYELAKRENKEDIHHTAFDTHLCSRKQELHLFHYARLFQECHFPAKKVVDWKLPKLGFLQKLIWAYTQLLAKENLKVPATREFAKNVGNSKEDENKEVSHQLALQKEQSDKRNYLHSKPIF